MTSVAVLRLALAVIGVPLVALAAVVAANAMSGPVAAGCAIGSAVLGITVGLALAPAGSRR